MEHESHILFAAILTLAAIEASGQTANNYINDNTIICVVENAASFPGGMDSLRSFIKENLVAPVNSTAGKVFVAFAIGEDGIAGEFEIVRGLTEDCNGKALEVMRKMPVWSPATQNGKAVKSRFVVAVPYE